MDPEARRIVLELALDAAVDVPMAQIASCEAAAEMAKREASRSANRPPDIEAHLEEFATQQNAAAVENAKGRGVNEAQQIADNVERLVDEEQAI